MVTAARTDGRGELASTLVEFALVLPVVIVLMLGIFSLGLIFYWSHILSDAAREGARRGAAGGTGGTDAEITRVVSSYTALLPNGSSLTPVISVVGSNGSALATGQRQRGGTITVTLTYSAQTVGVPGLFPRTKSLVRWSSFRMEGP
jgi:Flp pilus assembly protein TadG